MRPLSRFQVTPLHEGRRKGWSSGSNGSIFQVTPLHEGRLRFVTAPNGHGCPMEFQVTPLHEGRLSSRWDTSARTAYFKSRPYTRGDRKGDGGADTDHISSHAPTRGATRIPALAVVFFLFQVTPLHEGRHATENFVTVVSPFQVTPLHEGRRFQSNQLLFVAHFKSRPYTRGDPASHLKYGCLHISSHAPTRGATAKRYKLLSTKLYLLLNKRRTIKYF